MSLLAMDGCSFSTSCRKDDACIGAPVVRWVDCEACPGLGQQLIGLRADAEIGRLFQPQDATVAVDEDGCGNGEFSERAALRGELPELHVVEPVHVQLCVSEQRD